LGAYLEDDEEAMQVKVMPSVADTGLSQAQLVLLEHFANANYSLPVEEVDEFAQNNGVFKNQLIEGVNEFCYERIDDLLIEEEDDRYNLNPDYYRQLFLK
jgi:hypothetical protein